MSSRRAPQAVLVLAILTALSLSAGFAFAETEMMGSGAAWFDCDNDGHLDLFYLTPPGNAVFLVYDPVQEKFNDHSSSLPSGIQNQGTGMAVACGDVNNDGFTDIFLSVDGMESGGSNMLLLNNGDFTFENVGRGAGIRGGEEGEVFSASSAFLDYDNDGLLDIYVVNYMGFANQLFHNDGLDEHGVPSFTDVAPAMGVDFAQGGESDWGLGVAVADYDNDGDIDLYVANDYNGKDKDATGLNPGTNILYRNDNGTFVNATPGSGAGDEGWAMGTAFGDYNRDGWMDIYCANFWEDALLLNNQDGTFTDVTVEAGLRHPDWPEYPGLNGWGTTFFDYDNDGDLDIHVANGNVPNTVDPPHRHQQPDELWENRGPTGPGGTYQFHDVAGPANIDDIGEGRGTIYGDVNQDGFVDILVLNNILVDINPPNLHINRGDGTFQDQAQTYGIRSAPPNGPQVNSRFNHLHVFKWLEIRAVGTTSNASAIGARITVTAGSKTWIQDVGAHSYCSDSSPYRHFGLGATAIVDEISVRFPSGTVETLNDVPTNQILTITEPTLTPVRLFAFEVSPVPEGRELSWRFEDDGDLAGFAVSRIENGAEQLLAGDVRTENGHGRFLDRAVLTTAEVTYALDARYRDGGRERVGTVSFRPDTTPRIALGQSYPNPFTGNASIPVFAAPATGGSVEVFDTGGRLVRTLGIPAGESRVQWDGRNAGGHEMPAGAYFYRLAGSEQTYKMILKR